MNKLVLFFNIHVIFYVLYPQFYAFIIYYINH
jgi:hypothetical protein